MNAVVKRGVNDDQILELARHFRGTGHILRFIEYMDVGATNGWRLDDVVPAAEIVALIDAELPLEPAEENYRGEVARRWRYRDGGGEIGVIASVTQPFCGDCTRSRISAEGRLYTCLFATTGHDLRALLRGGRDDEELDATIGRVWSRRSDRYSEIRSSQTADVGRASRCPISAGEAAAGELGPVHGLVAAVGRRGHDHDARDAVAVVANGAHRLGRKAHEGSRLERVIGVVDGDRRAPSITKKISSWPRSSS